MRVLSGRSSCGGRLLDAEPFTRRGRVIEIFCAPTPTQVHVGIIDDINYTNALPDMRTWLQARCIIYYLANYYLCFVTYS